MNEKSPDSERSRKGISRRELLIGAGATAVALPMVKVLSAEAAEAAEAPKTIGDIVLKEERQRNLDGKIATIQSNLRQPKIRKAIEGRGKYPLQQILEALERSIPPEDLEGTTYDASELHKRFPVLLELPFALSNGVYFRTGGQLLTSGHGTFDKEKESKFMVPGIDLNILRTDPSMAAKSPRQIVQVDPNLTNDGIHERFITVVGIDPKTSKRKTHPGVAVRISPRLAESIGEAFDSKEFIPYFKNSLLFPLPYEDVEDMSVATAEGKKVLIRRVAGVSGSGAFTAEGTLAGTFWGAAPVESPNAKYGIGFIHGIDQVRRTEAHIKQLIS